MSLSFAPCIARIVQSKVWLVSPPKQNCPKQKVLKLQIAYCCGFLPALADYFPIFAFCLRTFCLWFGAFGDQHTTVFAIRQKKNCIIFLSLGAGRWDHAKTGGAGRNTSQE